MIPPSCHSNSYSPISREWREDELVVPPELKKVCPLKLDDVAVRYVRGNWSAWKDLNEHTPTRREVHKDKGRSVFWARKNGQGCPTVTTSYWEKIVDGTIYRKYYISGLSGTTVDGEPFSASFIRHNGTLEEDEGHTVNYDAVQSPATDHLGNETLDVNTSFVNSSHVLFIEPECHRLLLAQNIRLDPNRGVVTDKARLQWFAPAVLRSGAPGSQNYLTLNPNENPEVRPYQIPLATYDDWCVDDYSGLPDPTVPPYGVEQITINPNTNTPIGGVGDGRIDWRFNPKWNTTRQGEQYEAFSFDGVNPQYRIGDVVGDAVDDDGYHVDSSKYDGAVGMDQRDCSRLIDFACGLTPGRSYQTPLSDLKEEMTNRGSYHGSGEFAEWDAFDSVEDLIMLYGMKSTKHYRSGTRWEVDGQPVEGENRPNVNPDEHTVASIPTWVYTGTTWQPIYWTPSSSTDPDIPWGQTMMDKLKNCVFSYPRDDDMKAHHAVCPILHRNERMQDLIGNEEAFDLRMYCVRYNWKAKPIVPDRKYNEDTGEWEYQYEKYKKKDKFGRLVDVNGFRKDADGNVFDQNGDPTPFAFGEQAYITRMKMKVSDDPRDTKRGYFNTLCRADVRRIVRACPV